MTTIQKPWGSEKIWALTPFYTGKVINIRKGHRLSRQYHNRKVETIYVMNGPMTIEVGPDHAGDEIRSHKMLAGDTYHVPTGLVHRFCAPDADVVIMEVSTTEPNDVVRLDDDYGREIDFREKPTQSER